MAEGFGVVAAPDSGMERPARGGFPWHWIPVIIFVFYTALNMLDRQLLAAVAPTLKAEFHLSNTQYGALVSVFYTVSTAAAPLAGLFIDRVGLNLGASLSILLWSIAGAATGWTRSLRGLTLCRFGLGAGESGGSASPGAVLSSYMDPGELGIGAGLLGLGTSLGAIAAPLVAAALAPRYGWRSVFFVGGGLGLLWVPVWMLASKSIPARFKVAPKAQMPLRRLLQDRRFWGVAAAYALAKQTLWVSWTTIYFVQERHLSVIEANRRFSWYPSVFGAVGAFLVGGLALRWVGKGMDGMAARTRICWLLAPLLLTTAAVPFVESTTAAAVAVGLSFLGSVCIWSCAHLMPIDLYGVSRAAFAYSILECGVTLLQALVSPAVGYMVDAGGFKLVCLVMPILPLVGLVALMWCLRGTGGAENARSAWFKS